MFGNSASCVSEKGQCEFLQKDEFTWTVSPVAGTVNTTILNNKELSIETVIEDGMSLSIGNLKSGTLGLVMKINLIS